MCERNIFRCVNISKIDVTHSLPHSCTFARPPIYTSSHIYYRMSKQHTNSISMISLLPFLCLFHCIYETFLASKRKFSVLEERGRGRGRERADTEILRDPPAIFVGTNLNLFGLVDISIYSS